MKDAGGRGPKSDEAAIEALVRLSRLLGARSDYVLAGGGNTSVKCGDVLHVKASGLALEDITAEGFTAMKRSALRGVLAAEFDRDVHKREAEFKEAITRAVIEGGRPSVECALHEVIGRRFVVHLHPTALNAIACSSRGEEVAKDLFGEEVLWAPYVDPGVVLAKELARLLAWWADRTGRDCPRAILMQNHGVILGADDPDEIVATIDDVNGKAARALSEHTEKETFGHKAVLQGEAARRAVNVIGPALRGLLGDGDRLKIVTFDDGDEALAVAAGEKGREAALGGPLTPDQVVYCGPLPLWYELRAEEDAAAVVARLKAALAEYAKRRSLPPKVIIAQGLGVFFAGADFNEADTARLVYRDAVKVTAGGLALGGVRYLSKREYDFIDNWEVEAYRRRIAGAKDDQGRVARKVAIATGAAQGLGLEISKDLAAEGAHVALADINHDGAKAAAHEIATGTGRGRAIAVRMDVTSEDSVAGAIHEVVRAYGGFDVFVSNAGILKAESVKTQSGSDFDAVTAVNYRGYFLCVKHAVEIMAVQHLARGDWSGDIIQINSKSGLEGSNRNSAYSGSKFGGIGLTQSFALELIEDGIKVNAICPGNYFDGPLWSDSENGLFVQYLKSGKVPGAKTIGDVRRAYEAKVPMGRGCTTADVMKAIYYCIEQKYETGQAIAVTGGQVMLR